MKRKLPAWFPFALVSSFLVTLGAGIKSNWGRAENEPPPPPVPPPVPPTPPPPPPVQQAGILHEWLGLGGTSSRWFFWYVLPAGATSYGARGPVNLTDQEAFQLEFNTKTASLGARLYRFVWIPVEGVWIYDTRDDPGLFASREIRDERGAVVG